MKKTLKYKIVGNDADSVHIKITEQSHVCNEFGNKGFDSFEHNGFRLGSAFEPQVFSNEFVVVRGQTRNSDYKLIKIPYVSLEGFNKAVKAYNEFDFEDNLEFPIYFVSKNGNLYWEKTVYVKFTDKLTETYVNFNGKVSTNQHLNDNVFNRYLTGENNTRIATREEAESRVRVVVKPVDNLSTRIFKSTFSDTKIMFNKDFPRGFYIDNYNFGYRGEQVNIDSIDDIIKNPAFVEVVL